MEMNQLEVKEKLLILRKELENPRMTQQRVIEIKQNTLDIAKELDEYCNMTAFFVGIVEEAYRNPPTKLYKKRVKRVVNMLLDYLMGAE